MFKIIIFASGQGTTAEEIIRTTKSGILPAEVISIFYNREDARVAEIARVHDIEHVFVPFNKLIFQTRQLYDTFLATLVQDRIKKFPKVPTLLVLAGWMHLFTSHFLNRFHSKQIINLHPALPGQFPGKDGIKDAFEAYKRNEIKETGAMVHYVVEDMDAGQVIETKTIDIFWNDTLELLRNRVKYHEKSLIISGISKAAKDLIISHNAKKEHKPIVYRGKVREVHNIGNKILLLYYSDRLSSYDKQICTIRGKGVSLNAQSKWWMENTRDIIPNHMIYAPDNTNLTIARECKRFDIEVVVRAYIAGSTKTSLWTRYEKGQRNMYGYQFPDGLQKNQLLKGAKIQGISENGLIVTPTTKGENSDDPITEDEIFEQNLATKEEWEYIKKKALELFEFGQRILSEKGLILADTKYEFGRCMQSGEIILIDEMHTSDSSRIWVKETYENLFEEGKNPESLDKDLIRQFLKKECIPSPYECKDLPEIPRKLIQDVEAVYKGYIDLFWKDEKYV
jgi:formyltetrahydrofolate-dependent phosphoribosylglycinamide formyltransferase/phosphoribosylaminoimidazole-succinocarboxamide synthase